MIKLVVHAPPFSSGLLGTKDLKGRTPFPHCWTHHDGPFFGYVVGLVTGSVTGSLTKAEELELVLQRSKGPGSFEVRKKKRTPHGGGFHHHGGGSNGGGNHQTCQSNLRR